MKTAKDWLDEQPLHDDSYKCHTDWIKQIQLDAWKQGMTDAAEFQLPIFFPKNAPTW